MNDEARLPARQAKTDGAGAEKTAPVAAVGARALSSEEFYMEGGLLVFTAAYHLRRGYCCNSGCRHCPYTDCAE